MADNLDANHGTSDEYYDPFCDLCFTTKGHNFKAYGYCKECFQFLCSTCNQIHENLQASKHHTVLFGEDMPHSQSEKPPRFEDCEFYPKHCNDQFCFKHQILLCSVCSSSNHENCTIMDVDDARKFVGTSDVDSLYDTINDFKKEFETLKFTVELNVDKLKNKKENILEEAEKLYQEILSKVDELFRELKNNIDIKYQSCLSRLAKQQKQITDVVLRLESALNNISQEKNKDIDTKVFLRLQDALIGKELWKIEFQDVQNNFSNISFSMSPSQELQTFLFSSYEMATVTTVESKFDKAISLPDIFFPPLPTVPLATISLPAQPQSGVDKLVGVTKLQKLGTYRTKLQDEKNDSWISGVAVTDDGRKLMVDRDSLKVKMFSKDMRLLSSVALSNRPWDVTIINDREATVSAMNNKIIFLQIKKKKITVKQTIKLSFHPYGVTKYKDKLLVTAPFDSPASVKLIDLAAKVHWSVTTDKEGQIMFGYPTYVSSFDDQRMPSVIVSNEAKKTLILLNGDTGEIITRYQLKGKSPRGITTDTNGNIYVCYSWTREVAVLPCNLSKEKILLSSQDLSAYPQAIAYDDKANQLIISYSNHDQVDIYQL